MIRIDTAVEHTVECVCSQEKSAPLPRCHIQLSLQPDPKSHLHSVFCMSKDKGCILFTRGVKQNRERKKEGMVVVEGRGGAGSTRCQRLKLLSDRMKKPLLCRGRNSHSDISRPRTWKRLSVKYVIAFPTWRRSRDQEETRRIRENAVWWPESRRDSVVQIMESEQ